MLTHPQPVTSDTSYSMLPVMNQELLEKPSSKEDNLRMLLDMNGNVCEVVTGVVVGEIRFSNLVWIPLIRDSQHTLSSQLQGTIQSQACSEKS